MTRKRKSMSRCRSRKTIEVIVLAGLCIVIILTSRNIRIRHSAMLIEAIQKEDICSIQEILAKDSKCVNCTPVWFPRLDYLLDVAFFRFIDYPINAAAKTSLEMVTVLVEAGADPNAAVAKGYGPLHFTYSNKPEGWAEIAEYLINNGADVNYSNGYSVFALADIVNGDSWYSAHQESLEEKEAVNQMFIKVYQMCDREIVDWETLWSSCLRNNRIELANIILTDGYADINGDKYSWTPALIDATNARAKPETIRWLLDQGADPTLMDEKGLTALDYAIEHRDEELIIILNEAIHSSDES